MTAINSSVRGPGGRRRPWPAVVIVIVILQALLTSSPAQAVIPNAPARTWGVGPATTTSAAVGAPRVLAILPVGDRIVVGGTFEAVIDPAGRSYPAKNLAVFSASTGAADLQFAGAANNTVTSLATDGAGTLFVGGTFGTVNDASRNGLAALDLATGALKPWPATIVAPGQVDTLAYSGGALYAGGNFTAISDGTQRSRPFLAKMSAQSGAVDTSWVAAPNDRVRTINVAGDGSARLFIGGDFTTVSGKSSTSKIAAVFAAGSGAVDIAFRAAPTNSGSFAPVFDLTSDATRVYAAAAGRGGACTALNVKTGALLWSARSNGNMQSVRLSGGLLYCGGHFNGLASFMGQTRYKVAAVNAGTGALTAFAPNVNSSQGVWSMASDATRIYLGGDFSSISGVLQPHFAMFVDTAAQTTPRPPSTLTAQASDRMVQLSWTPPSTDGGTGLLKYRLYRATTPGGQDLARTPLATLSKSVLTYADTTVSNGTTYYYVVVATNALGASSPSQEASARPQGTVTVTPPGAPTGLGATTSTGAIRLTWTAPTNTGGAPITSYRVYRGTTPGGEDFSTPVGTPTTTSFEDTAVTAGTAYSYVVTAVNSAGEGARSAEVTATFAGGTAGLPGEPQLSGSLGTAPSGGPSADLQWTIPADGGSPILKYVILRDSVRLITLAATSTGPTTYSDTTIPSGSHVYQVKAVNLNGSGPLSDKLTITAP
jgi:fibronectin type 3 domain-containing protein